MIGIFDSGVGGMTVARAVEQICPGYPLVYLGDIARTPYGSKSPATIRACSGRNADFLLQQGARLVIIACNSAASVAAGMLATHCPVPVIDVIEPTVLRAVQTSRTGRVGIIGTRATVSSGIYQERICALRPGCTVVAQACPLLVPLVEEGWLTRRETKMIVKKYLHPLRARQIDTLILGCTHYPLLSPVIAPRIGRRVSLIDSSVEVARHLRRILDADTSLDESLYAPDTPSRFFMTDVTGQVQTMADMIFNRPIPLEKTDG